MHGPFHVCNLDDSCVHQSNGYRVKNHIVGWWFNSHVETLTYRIGGSNGGGVVLRLDCKTTDITLESRPWIELPEEVPKQWKGIVNDYQITAIYDQTVVGRPLITVLCILSRSSSKWSAIGKVLRHQYEFVWIGKTLDSLIEVSSTRVCQAAPDEL